MRAALLYGPRDIRVGEVPDPEPREGWIIVEPRAVGICGTDKAFYKGTYPLFTKPLVPGHEVSGVVVEGPEHLVGQKVVLEINFSCLKCDACRAGLYTHCPNRKTLGIDTQGGMAELVAAPAWTAHTHNLPHNIAFAVEPLAAVLNMFTQKPLRPGELVAIIGTGLIALLAAQTARLQGANVTIVARPGSTKAHILKQYGFEVLTFQEAQEKGKAEGLAGLGYDTVIEATGTNQGAAQAIALARPRGTVHLKSTPGGEAKIPQTLAVIKETRIIGTRCGTHREFKHAIRLLQQEKIKIPQPKTYKLEQAKQAFEHALQPQTIRTIIQPN